MYTLNEYLPIFVGDDLPEKGWDNGMYCLETDTGRRCRTASDSKYQSDATDGDLFPVADLPTEHHQIADRLHFADTPSFSKFFSRLKGISPKEYRKG